MPELVAQRIVPGAPPPTPLSKTQKKKRKAKAKSAEPGDGSAGPEPASAVEQTPEPSELQDAALAPEPVTQSDSQTSLLPEEEVLLKPSPIVDLIHKRLKATTKKISRISIYAATDPDKLNDDQKRTLKTLPTLEVIQKELGEVKKAVEVHESELVHELANKRIETEKADKARIADAVSAAEAALISKINDIVDLIRLRPLVVDGAANLSNIADSNEIAAIVSAADALLAEDEEKKQAVLNGLLFGTGDIAGLLYTRISEIFQQYRNPPRAPTPVQDAYVEEAAEMEAPAVAEPTADADAVVSAADEPTVTLSNSLRFMQESEIETPAFDGVWIEKADAVGHEEAVNGHAPEAPATSSAPAVNGNNSTIDWADDDEGGLPPIAGLQAKYGTSGSATPAEVADEVPETPIEAVNGQENDDPAVRREDDGFTQARGRGGRGRGTFRGGERGGHRGGYRGGDHGDRGGFRGGAHGGDRGGDRGGFRGGERGGFRGSRGGDRGGERGGFRGRANGEWRGHHDGERGRGGRGRGRSDRGGVPGQTQAPPTPA